MITQYIDANEPDPTIRYLSKKPGTEDLWLWGSRASSPADDTAWEFAKSFDKQAEQAIGNLIPVADSVVETDLNKKYKDICRKYGQSARTIFELRNENAALRQKLYTERGSGLSKVEHARLLRRIDDLEIQNQTLNDTLTKIRDAANN